MEIGAKIVIKEILIMTPARSEAGLALDVCISEHHRTHYKATVEVQKQEYQQMNKT